MKFFILIPLAALLATACTPTRPTAQARVALPWGAQQLTDSLKYLLAHVVRMDTAQYHVADGVFSMRPGATVHDLTVVGKLNVLAEPDNGLPDTIHLPHDSIPHLPGGGLDFTRTQETTYAGWVNDTALFNKREAVFKIGNDCVIKGGSLYFTPIPPSNDPAAINTPPTKKNKIPCEALIFTTME